MKYPQGYLFPVERTKLPALTKSGQVHGIAQHVIGRVNVANGCADISMSHGTHEHTHAHALGSQRCGKGSTPTVAAAVFAPPGEHWENKWDGDDDADDDITHQPTAAIIYRCFILLLVDCPCLSSSSPCFPL